MSDDWTVERHLKDKPADRVVRLDQLDADFAAWIAEACQVGQGAHLTHPPAR